ncbi:MAG: DUF4279 domain-containing protein [Flavobacteriaceae bacterium]
MTSPPEWNRQFAYFRAVGDGDAEDVSRFLGLEPNESWSAGESFELYDTIFRRTSSVWRLDSGVGDDADLREHIDALLEKLARRADGLKALREIFRPEIVCVGSSYQHFYVDLAKDRLQKATSLGLRFVIDAYGFGDLHEQMMALRELANSGQSGAGDSIDDQDTPKPSADEYEDEYEYAQLLIEASPKEVESLLGVPPDRGWAKGDDWVHQGGDRGPRRFSRSFIDSGLGRREPMDRHIVALLERLEPNRTGVMTMSAQVETTLDCVSRTTGSFNWSLDFPLQQSIAALGVNLGVDAHPGDIHEEITRLREKVGLRRSGRRRRYW